MEDTPATATDPPVEALVEDVYITLKFTWSSKEYTVSIAESDWLVACITLATTPLTISTI
jgi:hypothetical protein